MLSLLIPAFLKFSAPDPIIYISLDFSRNLLYSLALSNIIYVYSIAKGGCELIASLEDPYSEFIHLCPQSLLFKKEGFKIVSLFAINLNESSRYTLMALTSSGIYY